MSSVWCAYYNHWAKEANEIRRIEYLERCSTKTLKTIWKWFCQSEKDLDKLILGDCLYDLRRSLSMMIPTLFSKRDRVKDQMKYLREMADTLVPSHTPKDHDLWTFRICEFDVVESQLERTPESCFFAVLPAEVRFKKNLNLRPIQTSFFGEDEYWFDELAFMGMEFTTDEMRRLDALLAFLD